MSVRHAIVILLSAALAGCAPAPENVESPSAPIQVRVTTVQRGEIADALRVTGQTAALSVVRLASPVAGRVTRLAVRPGDQLEKGGVAARVIPLENEAALHGFRILEQAGALGASERQLTEHLRNDLAARDIPLRAPFAAVVAERLHNPNEQVAAGDVLLELFDPQSLYVLAQVPVESAPHVSAGMPVEVTGGAMAAVGEVAALVTSLEPQTLTVPVRIIFKAPIQPPLLHAAVTCRITVARHSDALLVPRSALLTSSGGAAAVMVAADDRAQRRAIRLGLRTRSTLEVTDGLREGEVVLVQGQYGLPDGAVIEPVQAGSE